MELVNTLRLRAAMFGHLPVIKRMVKICFGVAAAAFMLQFYYVRELVFMEAVVLFGFVMVALIVGVLALVYIGVLWLRKIGSALQVVGALVSARHRAPFAAPTTTVPFEAKEEVS